MSFWANSIWLGASWAVPPIPQEETHARDLNFVALRGCGEGLNYPHGIARDSEKTFLVG